MMQMIPELLDEATAAAAIMSGCLAVLLAACLIADFVFPHIPFIQRYLESLPDWDEEEEDDQ